MQDIFDYINAREQTYLEELYTLLRQKSISSIGDGMQECAALLSDMMRSSGVENATVYQTKGHPIIFGSVMVDESLPTLMVYGHYDVQPVEPLELWETEPFEPVIKDGRLFCRGCSDDKGQLYAQLKGMEAVLKVRGSLPINVKYLFEGEEEIDSPNLLPFVLEHKEMLRCDACIYSDGCYHDSGRPMILLGVKGCVDAEITVRTSHKEIHGMRSTAVPSAAWRMVDLLHTIKTEDGFIKIDDFYENVRPITKLEQETCDKIPYDEQLMLNNFGVDHFIKGRLSDQYYFNMVFEAGCNISGLSSGYVGKDAKGIIPNVAVARLCFKLVPNQTIAECREKLLAHLKNHGFSDAEVVFSEGGFEPCWTPIDDFYVEIARKAVVDGFGEEPVLLPSAAGGAPHYVFSDYLDAPTMEIPFASADQNNHAPNERMLLSGFFAGIRTSAAVILHFCRKPAEQ